MRGWQQPEKDTLRTMITENKIGPLGILCGVLKCVLLLPSDTCLDFKELWANKRVNKHTFFLVIEHNRAKARAIEATFRKYGIPRCNYKIIVKEIHQVDLVAELEGRKLDWVYIDTCTMLNRSMLKWIYHIDCAKVFTVNAIIYLAFRHYGRSGSKTRDRIRDDMRGHLHKTDPYIMDGYPNMRKQGPQHTIMHNALSNLFGRVSESFIYKNDDSSVVMHVFEFHMNTLGDNESQRCPVMGLVKRDITASSMAAYKAWTARRKKAQEVAKRQRVAGFRSWNTRRKQGVA